MPSPIQAVLFDAGFTLLDPHPSVADVYHREAVAVAPDTPAEPLAASLAEAWAAGRFKTDDDHASDEEERAAWHRLTEVVH